MSNSILAYAESLDTVEEQIAWMHEMKAFADEYFSLEDNSGIDPEHLRKMDIICQAFQTVLKDY